MYIPDVGWREVIRVRREVKDRWHEYSMEGEVSSGEKISVGVGFDLGSCLYQRHVCVLFLLTVAMEVGSQEEDMAMGSLLLVPSVRS